ncbi:MAG: HlyU family transcriptional regulator [Pseudomonadota bacterium]
MSFLKKLFGAGATEIAPQAADAVDYKGFRIIPTPIPEGSQFRLAATIERDIDGEARQHKLIRADVYASRDECIQFTVLKAQRVIDEQGERLFAT